VTPELIAELMKAGIPPALVAWWVFYSTRPKSEAKSEDPAKELARQLSVISDRQIRIETMVETLLERKAR
jgi:hypothetical protein